MKTILLPLLATLAGLLRSRAVLHLEILALRQQLAMVAHKDRKLRFRRRERLFWVWFYRFWPSRPGLEKVKGLLRKGDTLVVWRLDRLGRSLRDLIEWAQWLEGHGVALQSLKEAIDTTTPTGKLTFHLFGALAQFERDLIQERTQAGLAAARARGRKGGRRKALDPDKRVLAVDLYQQKKMSVGKICEVMGISKPTLYSYVRERQKAVG
jgi:DNA invertase Pin-like site-specific DNA recombinase